MRERDGMCRRGGFLPGRPLRSEGALLPGELPGQRAVERALAALAGESPETGRAVAVVVPARIVEDRMEADAADRHPGPARRVHLARHAREPAPAARPLGTGLGQDQRPAVALGGLGEERGERPVEGVAGAELGAARAQPLVARVVVEAHHVERRLLAAELGPQAAGDHLERLELRAVIRLGFPVRGRAGGWGGDVDERLGGDEAGARIDLQDRPAGGQRRAHQLRLERGAAPDRAGMEVADLAASPGPEGDLVDRHVPAAARGLGSHHLGRGAREGREAAHELGRPDVEPVRQAVMAEVPDHLDPRAPRRPQPWQGLAEIVAPRRALDAVPAQRVAGREQAGRGQAGVVGRGMEVVPGRGQQVDPPAVGAELARAVEAGQEIAAKELDLPVHAPATECKMRTTKSRARRAGGGPRAGSRGLPNTGRPGRGSGAVFGHRGTNGTFRAASALAAAAARLEPATGEEDRVDDGTDDRKPARGRLRALSGALLAAWVLVQASGCSLLAPVTSMLRAKREVYRFDHPFGAESPAFRRSLNNFGAALVAGNEVDILNNGDEIFPAMLAAIDGARRTVNMESYIFKDDQIGKRFADALKIGRA